MTYARTSEKRTVRFTVHHDGSSAVSMRTRSSDNIIEGSSDGRGGGCESPTLRGKGGGRSQKSCKTKESHCIVSPNVVKTDIICGKILEDQLGVVVRGRALPSSGPRKSSENLKRANDDRSREHKRLGWENEDRHRFKLGRNFPVQDVSRDQ